jgi:hypothetical protein
VKNASACARNLAALLKRLGRPEEPEFPDAQQPVAVLVMSFLLWESTTPEAIDAYRRLTSRFVDYNDFRVTLPYEMVNVVDLRDVRSLERCQRLRAVLNDMYRREHVVSLDRLIASGRRDVSRYLDTLEGMVPYVASRVALLSFDTPCVPIDDRLRALLIEEGAADGSVELPELAPWVSRQVKASQARGVHFALQQWSDRAAERFRARAAADAARSRRTDRKNGPGDAMGKATSLSGHGKMAATTSARGKTAIAPTRKPGKRTKTASTHAKRSANVSRRAKPAPKRAATSKPRRRKATSRAASRKMLRPGVKARITARKPQRRKPTSRARSSRSRPSSARQARSNRSSIGKRSARRARPA